jgi:hypothetical protein
MGFGFANAYRITNLNAVQVRRPKGAHGLPKTAATRSLSPGPKPKTPPGGVEVEVEVGFEPSALGEALRDTLLVAHPTGGEYSVPLTGRCGPPKPQGPISLAEVREGTRLP